MTYSLRDDRHPLDERSFADCGAAIAACHAIIDGFLLDADPALPAGALLDHWIAEGPTPSIAGPSCDFDARAYAARRVRELAGDLWSSTDAAAVQAQSVEVET